MGEYLLVNKRKIPYTVLAYIIVLVGLWAYNQDSPNGEEIDWQQKMLSFIIYAGVLIFALALDIMFKIIQFRRGNKILNSSPINILKQLGFVKKYSNKDSRWFTSMPILTGMIEDYHLKCEVEKGVVKIIADTDLDLMEQEHWIKLNTVFGKGMVENGLPGVAITYRQSTRKKLTPKDFENDLYKLVNILKKEQLHPYKNDSYA